MTEDVQKPARFHEIPVFLDEANWIWNLVSSRLGLLKMPHVRLPTTTPVRPSWERLRGAHRILIHWEGKGRGGGAIVEEILAVQPSYDVGDRVIVLSTNPTHEDVVYFAELGIRRIITLRHRDKELAESGRELDQHATPRPAEQATVQAEAAWRQLNHALESLPETVSPAHISKLERDLDRLRPRDANARYLDAVARVAMARGQNDLALKHWRAALDKNPNFYRAYHGLIQFHRRQGQLAEAMALMQKMHELNKQNISRLVGMGEIQMDLGDQPRAEFYFQAALSRDPWCSGALNGLAEIRFLQGDLDASRALLARSHLAYKTAANLNRVGITLVMKGKFETALEHYTKAQYVLPQQDKGPLLFYNIGLCYARWEKWQQAREFLRIALIKEPNYKKAKRLLDHIELQITGTRSPAVAMGRPA